MRTTPSPEAASRSTTAWATTHIAKSPSASSRPSRTSSTPLLPRASPRENGTTCCAMRSSATSRRDVDGGPMRLRQVALVARKLGTAVEEIRDVLGIEVGFNDPGVGVFGLENAVFPVGDTFLEVVSPVEEGTTAGRLLDRRGGDGGYMVIIQVDDLARERARMEAIGVRIAWEAHFDDAATVHLHPKDVGGAIVSLDWMKPPESWKWAGPRWKSAVRTDVVAEIVGV